MFHSDLRRPIGPAAAGLYGGLYGYTWFIRSYMGHKTCLRSQLAGLYHPSTVPKQYFCTQLQVIEQEQTTKM